MKTAIIGGGASGCACAIFAKRENPCLDITVFERNDRILKKILSTGNGKCNLSNALISDENYHSHNDKAVHKILTAFAEAEERQFFESLGILLANELGRLYPYSKRANCVSDALRFELENLGVKVKTNAFIREIKPVKDGFIIDGEPFDKAVIACGGSAAPSFGTDGNAFKLLKKAGHTIYEPKPALVALKVHENTRALKGIRAQCRISLLEKEREISSQVGELQLTDYGVSGIAVMQLSYLCRENTKISVDFFPDFSFDELFGRLLSMRDILSRRDGENFLTGLLHKSLAAYILNNCHIKINSPVSEISEEKLVLLAKRLKGTEFTVSSPLGWENAQTTYGGARLDEFFTDTLESRIMPNLYCIGEALDCAGDCGGYNLHWAWATAAIVGKSIAR
ncbi:MAG: aminoacetone oxidase family FAD-binding enzyme [Clostridia bacterium]|nr:aminoacetone oxidase family FAD-binding enzyme [Clostridia bacterium]